jgi:hypothetical protein
MKTFEDYYDLKQPNIVKWYGKLYNIADDIDRYYLEKQIEHHRYRLLYRNSIEGKLRTEYTLYRKELINRINSSPVETSKAQYTDNQESTIAVVFNSEYPDYPCDTFNIAGTPTEILGDFYKNTAAINRLLLESDKPVWIYAKGLYTALGIAYTEHSDCGIAYVEHGVNSYSWRHNPHCRRHRIAKEKDRNYEPVPKHKSTILTAWDHQTTAEAVTDPVRHLSESPRITYALEPETAGLELYQDYIYDWKGPNIQIVTEHHQHNLRLFIKNLTNR